MNNVFEYHNQLVMDSRSVAQMVGKEHKNLMRDIRGYIETMEDSSKLSRPQAEDLGWEYNVINGLKINPIDFFIPFTHINSQNKEQSCYLLTKMGCEMVANKLTGAKGVLFTAAYVSEFNRMEQEENQKQMIGERGDFGEIASVMREFRLWAKSTKIPYIQAMEAMIKFFHNTGVPFPEEMSHRTLVNVPPEQITLWSKEALNEESPQQRWRAD